MGNMPAYKANLLKLDIDLNRLLKSYNEEKEDLELQVSGEFYFPKEHFQSDLERLFISIMAIVDETNQLVAQVSYVIPTGLVMKKILFDHIFYIRKDILQEVEYLGISFATTAKHDGEMGIGASIIAGTFFENFIPIDVSSLVEDERDGK